MKFSDAIGFAGVTVLLIAFLLNIFNILNQQSRIYITMNLVGGGLACAGAVMISYVPFIILEGTWALVAGVALIRSYLQVQKAK